MRHVGPVHRLLMISRAVLSIPSHDGSPLRALMPGDGRGVSLTPSDLSASRTMQFHNKRQCNLMLRN